MTCTPVEVAECSSCQNCSGWDANERMNHIPRGIDPRDFVRDKFNDVKTKRNANAHQLVKTSVRQAAASVQSDLAIQA
jgi:hypothetical protein